MKRAEGAGSVGEVGGEMARRGNGARWRERVAASMSIARIALERSGGHVAATRVLHDGLFVPRAAGARAALGTTDCAVLIVALDRDGARVGVLALADRSGRVFSDDEVALAERLMRDVVRCIGHADGHDAVQDGIARLLHALGGETAAVYAVGERGAELSLVASSR